MGLMVLVVYVCSWTIGSNSGHAHRSASQSYRSADITPEGQAILHRDLEAGRLPDMCFPDFKSLQAAATAFYAANADKLAWIQNGQPTEQALALIRAFGNAEYKGLSPEDYDASRWQDRLDRFGQSPEPTEAEVVEFDIEVTLSTMRYISDLHSGRISPQSLQIPFDHDPADFDLPGFIFRQLIRSRDVGATLSTVEPSFPVYLRTEAALKTYLGLLSYGDGDLVPVPQKPPRPGIEFPDLPALLARLKLLGDLPENYMPTTDKYQRPVVDAVKHFQARHGLDANGVLDAATVEQLNVPLSDRVAQLQLTLERIRWLPRHFARPPIVVNIPEFRLHADDEQFNWVFSMAVVVGKAYRHKTPVFASSIQAVIFRPYWNVPPSIVKAELIPHIEKDPSYLVQNAYELVDQTGSVVSSDSVSSKILGQIREGKLRIRQIPGPKNSLGLIKFDIPSAYDVYMHGTPETELFSRSRRDFSHGCIRVEDPVKLARWVLRGQDEWSEERIRSAMDGDATVEVKLDRPVPVLIVYGTAVVAEDGEVRFFKDVYGYDASLEKALAARHSASVDPQFFSNH
jgi:L,D-transpeptidase YcbB